MTHCEGLRQFFQAAVELRNIFVRLQSESDRILSGYSGVGTEYVRLQSESEDCEARDGWERNFVGLQSSAERIWSDESGIQ